MSRGQTILTVRWTARLLSAALFLLWGAFFLEHTTEWFANPFQQLPPLSVILTHGCHLLLLVSLVLAWFWEAVGGAMIILVSIIFFISVGAPQYLILTAVPGVLFLVSSYLSWQQPTPSLRT